MHLKFQVEFENINFQIKINVYFGTSFNNIFIYLFFIQDTTPQ